MKKYLSKIILVVILIIGLGMLAYPTVSNWWNEMQSSKAVAAYQDVLELVDEVTLEWQWEAARAFNAKLLTVSNRWFLSESMEQQYFSLLDVSGTGLMSMLTIPTLNVTIPVYHGDSDAVLQIAAGHMVGTSLPVGGLGTHAVIAGHTGLPSAQLFTGLDTLQVGDTFMLETLNRKLVYEISDINVVLPGEMELLAIDKDKDLVTLLTCTPYGVNSHRLLVTGTRVEFESEAEVERAVAELEARSPVTLYRTVLIVLAIGLLLALILVALWLRKWIQGR